MSVPPPQLRQQLDEAERVLAPLTKERKLI
jgi:hypothetical protein